MEGAEELVVFVFSVVVFTFGLTRLTG